MNRLLYSIYLLLLFATLASCRDKQSGPDLKTEADVTTITISREQFEGENMALGEIEERPFSSTIHVTGTIHVPPQNRAVVSAFMGGYIKDTPLLIGDVVKRGQSLVTIENPEFVTLQQNYMEAKEKLNYLKAEYERQIQLRSENITSQKNFLKAESEFKTVQAQYNGLNQRLRMLNFSTSEIEAGTLFRVSKTSYCW